MGKILISLWVSFSGLGIYRGVKQHSYNYNKSLKAYEESLNMNPDYTKPSDKPKYYTIDAIGHGLVGFVFYVNPILTPIMLSKEIRRLETNLRGYDDEKEKDDYFRIF
jgi:hypothetical protein